jgi:hypothetical protein
MHKKVLLCVLNYRYFNFNNQFMTDLEKMPSIGDSNNKGKTLFTATFRLYKFGNFVMEDEVTILAYNQEHFMSRFGYQKKLQEANILAAKCNYTLEISITK